MKEVLLFSVLIFLLAPKVSAETIVEGKSSVYTSVTNNVNSSSDSKSETKTHIEIEVNGEKKVLDTNEPGTHTLSIESNGGKSSATVKVNNTSSSNSTATDGAKQIDEEPGSSIDDDGEVSNSNEREKIETKTIIQRIFDQISEFFKNLFSSK